jgi:hypothetical protein
MLFTARKIRQYANKQCANKQCANKQCANVPMEGNAHYWHIGTLFIGKLSRESGMMGNVFNGKIGVMINKVYGKIGMVFDKLPLPAGGCLPFYFPDMQVGVAGYDPNPEVGMMFYNLHAPIEGDVLATAVGDGSGGGDQEGNRQDENGI